MNLGLEQVQMKFGDTLVLDQLTQAIESVQSLVLIGPSGGGKSTLLRLLAGLMLPTSGCISVNDERIPTEEEALRRYRAQLGVVFQTWNLFPHLSALENIILPLTQVHGHDRGQASDLAMGYLQRFHLESQAQQRPYELSGGQRQRVAIARALAGKPKLLLFDEPTSALDPEMTGEVLDVIQELREEGGEIILVTHEMGFARMIADHLWFIAEGRICESGPPTQVMDNPQDPATVRFLARVFKY